MPRVEGRGPGTLLPNEIDLLLDGEVGFGVTPLKAHVRRCAQCRAELEEARAVTAELESLPHLAPSSAFADRVMAQVQVFEPAHVAVANTARRWMPQSRPARVLAGAAAMSAALVLSISAVWLGTNLDSLLFVSDMAAQRGRGAVATGFGRVLADAFGQPAVDALATGGIVGVAIAVTLLVATVLVAVFGLRAAATASRRRRT
jgi:hypothetical protein